MVPLRQEKTVGEKDFLSVFIIRLLSCAISYIFFLYLVPAVSGEPNRIRSMVTVLRTFIKLLTTMHLQFYFLAIPRTSHQKMNSAFTAFCARQART